MRRVTISSKRHGVIAVLGVACSFLLAGAPLMAQTNPATAKAAAQTGARTVQVPVAARPPASTRRAPAAVPAAGPTPRAAKAPAEKPAILPVERPGTTPGRRDPFSILVNKETSGNVMAPVNLPPGKSGLQVQTLMIQGIVGGPSGMIAVVANPQQRVYFLREGDQLFDGTVEHIAISGVTFHEVGKDAFGKPLEREVTRRLSTSSGEQP